MSTRSERDKGKAMQEKHQAILSALLKDEDNKYCVDCDAKGPRWASWNLGIFLCIRCAGIHRNLGVHISKVKSVNLDTWTPEQIAMMQEMGNSRARAVYEANLQDNFRRPQTDSGLEAFIRAKYEQKKYIAKEWIPPQVKVPHYIDEEPKKEKKKSRPKTSGVSLPAASSSPTKKPSAHKEPTIVAKKPDPPKPSAAVDLLGLDDPSPVMPGLSSGMPAAPVISNSNDLFGDFISSSTASHVPTAPASVSQSALPNNTSPNSATNSTVPNANNAAAGAAGAESLSDVNLFGTENGGDGKKSKDSILALYGAGGGGGGGAAAAQQQQTQQQQMFAMQGNMYGAPVQNHMMNGMAQQPNMMQQQQQPQHQPAMWVARHGAMQQAMAQQQMAAAMMGGMGQYNMGAAPMYGMQQQQQQQQFPQQQQQQQQYQQMQHQFSGMSVGGAGYSQPQAPPPTQPANMWGGQTLSNNLWQ